MKNFAKFLGIIALVAVIGFSMTACEEEEEDNGGDGGGGGGGGGTFTLTSIPSEYNGKYVYFVVNEGTINGTAGNPIAFGSTSGTPGNVDSIRISNGRVSIPLWKGADDGVGFQRYTGTVTACCWGDILDTSSAYGSRSEHFEFDSISFTNGSATKSWNDIDKLGY
jgi:hypothetical protein